MKPHKQLLHCVLSALFVALASVAVTSPAAGWRLIGLTGQQGDTTETVPGVFDHPDRTLYQINTASAAVTKLFQATLVPDTICIGYCPSNNLAYYAAGVESWGNDPTESYGIQGASPDLVGLGYVDSQYLEAVNLVTQARTAIFNANPPPNPDPSLFASGLVAPRPSWVLPTTRRDSTQTDGSFRVRGPNEYHAVRGMAWYADLNAFLIAAEHGIYRLTPEGDSTFLFRPQFHDGAAGDSKGILFVSPTNPPAAKPQLSISRAGADVIIQWTGGEPPFQVYTATDVASTWTPVGCSSTNNSMTIATTDARRFYRVAHRVPRLFTSSKDGVVADPVNGLGAAMLMEICPTTGERVSADDIFIYSGWDPFEWGILGMAQHPETGVIYAIRKTADAFSRELVTFSIPQGTSVTSATLVGNLGLHFNSLTFAPNP
jgi:hypothetical protein